MGLTWKDAGATLIVATIGALSWAYFTDLAWPGFSGPRVVAVASFLLGVIACATGARAMNKKEADLTPADRVIRLHAIGAFGIMLWAAITGSEVALAILVGLIGVMWLGSTIAHLFSKPAA